jgi:hypothetical protein
VILFLYKDAADLFRQRVLTQRLALANALAELYGVPAKVLNQAVRRNRKRFPDDFMFQLSKEELENWRSQIVTSVAAARLGLRRPPLRSRAWRCRPASCTATGPLT